MALLIEHARRCGGQPSLGARSSAHCGMTAIERRPYCGFLPAVMVATRAMSVTRATLNAQRPPAKYDPQLVRALTQWPTLFGGGKYQDCPMHVHTRTRRSDDRHGEIDGLCRAAVVVQVCSGLKCDGIMCGQNSDVGVENGKLNWECVRCSCNPRPFGRTCTRTMPTHTHALVQSRKRLPHVCSGKCIKTCESTLINDCGTCKGGNCHCAKGELR